MVNGSPCGAPASKNHAIQKKNTLKKISVRNQVSQIEQDLFPKDGQASMVFKTMGIGKASIFRGLCARHDSALFSTVEKTDAAYTRDAVVRLFYRAYLSERYSYQVTDSIRYLLKKRSSSSLRKLMGPHLNREYQKGVGHAYRDLELCRSILHRDIFSNEPQNLKTVAFRLERPLPFCFQSARSSYYDFNDALVLPRDGAIWDKALMFGGFLGGSYYLIASSTHINPDHKIDQFLQSFSETNPWTVGARALFLALRHCVGCTYLSPEWVESLPSGFRNNLALYPALQVGAGLPRVPYNQPSLGPRFDFKTYIELVS